MSETRIALQRGRQGQVVLGQRWDRCRWRKIRSAYEAPSLRWCSAVYYSERFLRQPGLDPRELQLRERLPGKFGRTVMAIAIFAAAAMLAVPVVALTLFAVQRQLRGKPREHQKASHPPTADSLDSGCTPPPAPPRGFITRIRATAGNGAMHLCTVRARSHRFHGRDPRPPQSVRPESSCES